MYSAGIVLLQMAIPTLRSTSGLKNFYLELKTVGYDLRKWWEKTRSRPDLSIPDLHSGRGWDLATKLISQRGFLRRGRLSAGAALRHPSFLLADFYICWGYLVWVPSIYTSPGMYLVNHPREETSNKTRKNGQSTL